MSTWLPRLVTMADHDHDWPRYLGVIHGIFRGDFVDRALPTVRGTRMNLKRHPMINDMEATFWHLISEAGDGGTEDDRVPNLRRCERIAWPRPIIEAVDSDRVKAWPTLRGRETRMVLAVEDFSYIVIVAIRNDYALLWTAYPVEEEHRRRKLKKEYQRWADKPDTKS